MGTSGLWLVAQNPGDSLTWGWCGGGRCWGTEVDVWVDGVGVEVDCRGPAALGGGLRGGGESPNVE